VGAVSEATNTSGADGQGGPDELQSPRTAPVDLKYEQSQFASGWRANVAAVCGMQRQEAAVNRAKARLAAARARDAAISAPHIARHEREHALRAAASTASASQPLLVACPQDYNEAAQHLSGAPVSTAVHPPTARTAEGATRNRTQRAEEMEERESEVEAGRLQQALASAEAAALEAEAAVAQQEVAPEAAAAAAQQWWQEQEEEAALAEVRAQLVEAPGRDALRGHRSQLASWPPSVHVSLCRYICT
jgi:hypothetical protein